MDMWIIKRDETNSIMTCSVVVIYSNIEYILRSENGLQLR